MSISTEVSRLKSAKSAIKAAIEGKGVTVPDATLLDGMAALIESIETGGGASIARGTITPASLVNYIEVTHGLGVIPNFAFIIKTYGSDFSSNTYAACFKDVNGGVGILRAGANTSQIFAYYRKGSCDITSEMPTSSLMNAYAEAVYAANEQTVRFGNENLTSVAVNFNTQTYTWYVGVIDV